MFIKNYKILLPLALLGLLLAGCSITIGDGKVAGEDNDGGVFKSIDKGKSWQQQVLIPSVGGIPRSFASVNVLSLAFDPSDHQAIYAATEDNGLFYSYDSAQSWSIAVGLGKVTVSSAAVDPNGKCTIYAAVKNSLYKSTDCNRSWSQVYFDTDMQVKVEAVVIDNADAANIYLGTSRGEIIRSSDHGTSWQTLERFDNGVKKIVISSVDNKLIFVGTANGVSRSQDGGGKWAKLNAPISQIVGGSLVFRDLELAKSAKGYVLLATSRNLLTSSDNGDNWRKIDLITSPDDSIINTAAVNAADTEEIYYATNTTFYHSVDGGKKWITRKLPTSRAGWQILVDPVSPDVIYLGVKALK